VDVGFDPDHRHATFVVVRLRLFRSSVVPVEAIEAVVPATRLVVLESLPRRSVPKLAWLHGALEAGAAAAPPVARACARTSLRFGSAALLAAGRTSTAVWSATRRLGRWSAPRAVRGGRAIARGGALAISLTALALAYVTRRTRALAPRAARRVAIALAAAATLGAVLFDELAASWVKRRAHHH
jgi:hypothetical protein